MMVYVVNLGIEASMASEYPAWLCAHANDMLALPGFLAAEIFERLEPLPEPGRVGLSMHYRLHDRAAFDAYLRDHSPRMREAGLRAFGDRVRTSRDLLQAPE